MLNTKFRATRLNIGETIKTGTSVFGKYVYAKISRKDCDRAGFAIVVSKKNDKTSVGRHKIKRKISSYIEPYIKSIKPDFKKTVVFLVKKTENPIDYTELEKDIVFIIKKINL